MPGAGLKSTQGRSKTGPKTTAGELAAPDRQLRCFVSCAPGLEPWLEQELRALKFVDIEAGKAGVQFRGDLAAVQRANLELGVGLHVLVRLARFPVRQLSQLDRWAKRVDWGRWFAQGSAGRVEVTAHCHRSKLYHSGAVCERVSAALAGALGSDDLTTEVPAPKLQLRLVEDLCTVSLDTSGLTLHKRGWRALTSKAPLREDIARALLLASGWPKPGCFLDPMCGSGTLAIEAASMLAGQVAGWHRRFAFEQLACFDDAAWQGVRRAAAEGRRVVPGRVFAGDHNREVVELAAGNIAAAGLTEAIDIAARNVDSWADWRPPEAPLLVVTNPPWGRRLADAAAPETMQALGGLLRRVGHGSSASMVAPNRRLVDPTRLRFEARPKTHAGGVQVGLHLNGRVGKRGGKNKQS